MFVQPYSKLIMGLMLTMYACSPSEKKDGDTSGSQTVILEPLEFKSILEKTPEAVFTFTRK